MGVLSINRIKAFVAQQQIINHAPNKRKTAGLSLAAAVTERTHATTKRKQRAVLCRLRSVQYHRTSAGGRLALHLARRMTAQSNGEQLAANLFVKLPYDAYQHV